MANLGALAKGIGVGAITGICVGLGVFYLMSAQRSPGMGQAMFFLVPFAAGFAVALVTRQSGTRWAGTILAVLTTLAMLISMGEEGILCAILAFPLLLFGLAVGAIAGSFFRRRVLERFRHQGPTTGMLLLLMPALIFAGHRVERQSLENARRETVSNTIRIQAKPDEVWTQIQSIDSINVPKPLLMHFGLPVPVRCTLERASVGAKRTCYFETGYIEEIITEWRPPYSMRLTVDRTNMPGRHWLGFESAAYELRQDGDTTELTRTTTITSHLYPVWYWRYFERLGVASEHDYILRDLGNRMRR